jgi:DNA-binding CsgD family transcriptional regulator
VFASALDPSDLEQYRAEQVTYPVDQATLEAGNIWQLLQAAERHGVGVWWALFESAEFFEYWFTHAWREDCRYINEAPCEEQDRGFLSRRGEIFTDLRAIQAAKDRIKFVLDTFGGSSAIAVWEICTEMTWLTGWDFWELPRYDHDALLSNVREKMVPWMREIAGYLRDNDPLGRPVANSLAFVPPVGEWPADPDAFWNVVNEIHDVPEIDIVAGRWYFDGDLGAALRELRMIEEKYPDKLAVIGEYWPFTPGQNKPVSEESPYLASKAHQWLSVCAGRYGFSAARWPGLSEIGAYYWRSGGYADPGMAEIAGVTRVFDEVVGWEEWDWGVDRAWDQDILAPGADLVAGRGDGRRVVLFVRWPHAAVGWSSGDVKPVTVSGLEAGDYTLAVFDWVTGDLVSTEDLTATGGFHSRGVVFCPPYAGGLPGAGAVKGLTERQRMIVCMVTLPNKAIARQLGISRKVVATHFTRVLRKLGAENRLQALLIALRRGVVSLDEVHPGDVREKGEMW